MMPSGAFQPQAFHDSVKAVRSLDLVEVMLTEQSMRNYYPEQKTLLSVTNNSVCTLMSAGKMYAVFLL